MNLPPLTFAQAANLYRVIESSEGLILDSLLDPSETPAHLASALCVFGRQLEKDKQVIEDLQQTNVQQAEMLLELSAHLRAYTDEERVRELERDDAGPLGFLPASEEALVDLLADAFDAGAREDVGHSFSEWLADLRGDQHTTAVEWRGPGRNYFDNFEAINHELAKGISQMARQRIQEGLANTHDDAIEVTNKVVEDDK